MLTCVSHFPFRAATRIWGTDGWTRVPGQALDRWHQASAVYGIMGCHALVCRLFREIISGIHVGWLRLHRWIGALLRSGFLLQCVFPVLCLLGPDYFYIESVQR